MTESSISTSFPRPEVLDPGQVAVGALSEGPYSSRDQNLSLDSQVQTSCQKKGRPHPGQCDPAPLHSRPRPRCWARSFTASPAGPWVPRGGPPTSLRSAGRKRPPSPTVTLRFLPPAGREGTFPVHTKVSLAADAQTRAQPLPLLPMEPALGPGVQVTSQGGH